MIVFLRRLWWCLLLLSLQVLLLDRFSLFGLVVPSVIMFLVLILDSDVSPFVRMLWGFGMGLIADIFVSTQGVQAASLTLLAYLQPNILRLFTTFDRRTKLVPGIVSMGFGPYLGYLFISSLLFTTVVVVLSTSVGSGLWHFLLRIMLGTGISTVLMLLVDVILRSKRRKSYR